MRRFSSLATLLPGLLAPIAAVPADEHGPTVGQLLRTCELGRAPRNAVDAAACEWFAVPCGCKPGTRGSEAGNWCIPEGEPLPVTVERVLDALADADPSAPAPATVAALLPRLYPCR